MDPLNNVDAKIQKEPLLQQVLKEIGIANQESDKVKSEMILKHKNLIPQYEEKEKRIRRKRSFRN